VLPGLYFHVTAVYAPLRGEGVPPGKSDFITGPDGPSVLTLSSPGDHRHFPHARPW